MIHHTSIITYQLAWLVSTLLFSSQLQLGFDTCADRAIMSLRRCSSNTSNNNNNYTSGSSSNNNHVTNEIAGKTGLDSDTLRLDIWGDRNHSNRVNIQVYPLSSPPLLSFCYIVPVLICILTTPTKELFPSIT